MEPRKNELENCAWQKGRMAISYGKTHFDIIVRVYTTRRFSCSSCVTEGGECLMRGALAVAAERESELGQAFLRARCCTPKTITKLSVIRNDYRTGSWLYSRDRLPCLGALC